MSADVASADVASADVASAFRRKDEQYRRKDKPGVLVLAFALLVAAPAPAEIIDRVLASVDSAIVTQSDVYAALRLGLVKTDGAVDPVGAVLERLIERRLTLNEVERYGPPEPTEEQIDGRQQQITSRFPPGRLDSILAESGLTRENLRRYVRDDLRIQFYLDLRLGASIQPSEEEILQYYEQHRAAFTAGGVARPFNEVHDAARGALIAERRNALITDWLAGLRKRANVSVLPR